MGSGGRDVLLSNAALNLFPYAVEAKNHARIAVYSWFSQCISNAGEDIPLLVIKQNRSEPLAVLRLKDFMELCANQKNN